jgi:integrase/recombinase XerD
MASSQIVLRQKQSKDNTFPLAIRITKDRKTTYMYVGQYIKESEWDSVNKLVKKSHPNSARLNNFLKTKLAEANDKLLEMETKKKDVTPKKVKEGLKPIAGVTFSKQADIYLENLKKNKKYNRISAETPRINRFMEFLKEVVKVDDILFDEITIPLLHRYQAYLRNTRTIKERTVVNHLVIIRSIYNQAVKGHLIEPKSYPFGKGGIQIKFPDSIKVGLTIEEVQKIEGLKLQPDSLINHARNIWLFSFYFAGMRVSDVLRLKWADFQNDRLYYSMGKNAKAGSLKIPEKAANIILLYKGRDCKNDLVFPDLEVLEDLSDVSEVQRKISYAVKRLDKYLLKVASEAELDKKLTMHIARHTFGNISGDKIPLQMLQKLYRHTSIVTTIGYQANFIHKDADEALDSVVSF